MIEERESEQTLHGCSDFQDLIPGFVHGSVTGPRALLVEDHTRECVACRRLLMEEHGALSDRSTHNLGSATNRFPRLLGMAAAAMIAIGLAVAGIWSAANSIAERGLSASLESVDGQLLLVSDDGSRALTSDDQIRARQTLRTTRDSDAVLRLADGYLVIAPDIALVHQALQYRESGVNLPSSTIFRELLPDNGYTDCSALLYRNLGPLAESLPDAALGEVPPDAVTALSQPMLFCIYGQDDRIILSGIGDGLLGAGHAIGLSSALKSFHPAITSPGPVSSQG
jgi:hypothetical protein